MNKPSDEMINNVLHGLATKDEAERVARWFATDCGQQYLSDRMQKEFFEMNGALDGEEISHSIPSGEIWNKIEKRTFVRRSRRLTLKIAAVLVPILFIAGIAIQQMTKENRNVIGIIQYSEVYVPKGEQMQLKLSDGTLVYLNSDSRLSYPEKFGKSFRNVSLAGEAYFEVKKDAEHPFVIELNGASIEVLGTSFNVKAYSDDDIDIALDAGRINLISSSQKKYKLLPQETLLYNRSSENVVVAKNQDTGKASEWKNNIISFSNAPLSEVVRTLNRYYDVEFQIEDEEVLQYSYTLTTPKVALQEILSDLEKISPVRFIYKDDVVIVRMKS